MLARSSSTSTDLSHLHRFGLVLPDGRQLSAGDEFSVRGEGRFRFHYAYVPDGSVTAWGPITGSRESHAGWRSFKPTEVGAIHRKQTERRAK
jgi:hypothetical protein